ncbi:hypothetical protein [Inconstantimicrobium mannanitabidum]|uniref:Uncharacterized protein n=1 Tax=Inconstantimicrobium mannanitabidum TaxID=1604901 RepID=A0ACB5R925_9CLOT|nr:hypothetical protein [Clostridium sp. TW13]GKX65637.1 hypothetical protein rsdtw13_08950 [Clostridium sp. TW13]
MNYKESLLNMIDIAIDNKSKYIAVVVVNANSKGRELIINPTDNFDYKKEYYNNAYDDTLKLKACKDISIVAFAHDSDLSQLAYKLRYWL